MDEAAARAALRHFGIEPGELKLVSRQPDRGVWQVTAADEAYALKWTRQCKRAPKIGAVGHYLHRRGVPVVMAIPTTAGDLFVQMDGCCFLLFPWVSGVRPLYEDRRMTAPMATLLAQFHAASRGYVATGGPIEDRLPRGMHHMHDQFDEVCRGASSGDDPFSRTFGAYAPWLRTRAEWVTRKFARNAGYKSLVTAARHSPLLVHGDYSAVNLLADEAGRLTIIDLDEVGIALPVWELSRLISWMNHDSLGWSGERFETVLRAYREVRPVSAAEENLLRIDLVYPRQALSLAREYGLGGPPDTGLTSRLEQCIAADIDMLRYLGISL